MQGHQYNKLPRSDIANAGGFDDEHRVQFLRRGRRVWGRA